MTRFSIDVWLRCAVLISVMIPFAECAGFLWKTYGVQGVLSGARASIEDPASEFLSRVPVVEAAEARESRPELMFEGFMPDLNGGVAWLNSSPLSPRSLRGKVVLINFWTYTCINSLRPLPYVKEWSAKYETSGLIVIGVHTPEFSFEREQRNVETALREHNVAHPVVMDNNYQIWRAFNNEYWPAFYLIDAKGQIRYHHFGEGAYKATERAIQELLKENGSHVAELPVEDIVGHGIEAPSSEDEGSPESYIGYRQAVRFASPGGFKENREKIYSPPARLALNHWGLIGPWNVNTESAVLISAPGRIVYRFHSRDVHLVLAPSKDGRPIRFKVMIDGAAPGNDCGIDSSPDGTGIVREPRLYQLIRQKSTVEDRTVEIEFLDPGVQALDFTFG